jgi:hypothetical protein
MQIIRFGVPLRRLGVEVTVTLGTEKGSGLWNRLR